MSEFTCELCGMSHRQLTTRMICDPCFRGDGNRIVREKKGYTLKAAGERVKLREELEELAKVVENALVDTLATPSQTKLIGNIIRNWRKP